MCIYNNIHRDVVTICAGKEDFKVSLQLKELVAIEFKRNGLFYLDKIGEVFELYADLLVSENKKYNLTSIINPQDIKFDLPRVQLSPRNIIPVSCHTSPVLLNTFP